MGTETQKARLTEAISKLAAVQEEYADVFGPQNCSVHDDCDLDSEDCVVAQPEVVMVQGWVLLTEWSQIDGTGSLEYMMPMEQPFSMTLGLIRGGERVMMNDMFG